ncbi:MAG: hypothetical protein KIT82_12005 [Bradyrhizobium sp.]|nr:hypothetical protein [Bradyrhizobium sp.]
MPEVRRNSSPGLPALAYALTRGTTWALSCRACHRQIAVDVVNLVEGVDDVLDFDSGATFARAKCRECGGQMHITGGFQVAALKHTGHMPRLITRDGTYWRRLEWPAMPGG